MVRIAGYIVFPCVDDRDFDDESLRVTSAEVLGEIRRLLGPWSPDIHTVVQNAFHGVAFFNFSNHAGARLNALEQCSAYLHKLRAEGFPVDWHMDFQDEETGEKLVLKSERN